jgi:uncharacterized membrane protein YfcA
MAKNENIKTCLIVNVFDYLNSKYLMIGSAVVLFLCALLAFGLSAVCGGGASFILLPLLGWVLPGSQVPAALSIGTASSSLSRIWTFCRSIRWEIVIWFVPAALPAVWLGSWLLTFLNPVYLELIMGVFLLTNLPFIFRPAKKAPVGKPMNKITLSFIGAAAGFVSGLTGAVGLLFNRFYLRYGMSKEEIVATRATNEILLHLLKLGLYLSFGLLTSKAITYGFIIALAAIISSLSIKWILPLLSEKLFQRLGYIAMVLSGMFMFGNASVQLANTNNLAISYSLIAEGAETKFQWKRTTFALEFEYDQGFEVEATTTLKNLPLEKQQKVIALSKGADKVLVEEVFGINKHYYEAYIYKNGKAIVHDL